jgi:nitrogen fixation NifU-like protein
MTEVDAELIAHMSDPKNYGRLEEPDAIGIGENPENGEKVIIYLRIIQEENIPQIEDIKFEAIGCMTTVVAGSVVTQEAKGISFPRAEELIAVTLGMLEHVPPEDAACSEMVALSLQAAMDTYRSKQLDASFGSITYKIENSCVVEEEEA